MAQPTTNDLLPLLPVHTHNCGVLHVYVQGNLEERAGKTIILTVHDVGTNHKSFIRFVNHPSMADVKAKTIFLHICVPGQEDHAGEFVADFPSLSQIGEDLVAVLDKLEVQSCIAFGEGAGANIVARFASEKKDKAEYIETLKSTLNPKNLSKYLLAFTKRTDLSALMGTKLDTVDALLVAGGKASHLQSVYTTHKNMNRKKTTLLVVDNVCDVMTEAPENLARSLILLCKGCGVLSGVAIPGMERQRTLSSSMEEADRPRRLSVTNPPPALHT